MIAERFLSHTTVLRQGMEREAASSLPLLVTPAIVGFYFSFRAAIGLVAVRLFALEQQTGAGMALGIGFILLLLVIFQTIGPPIHPLRWFVKLPSLHWVAAYLTYAGCSFAWSGAASLSTSFLYWCGVMSEVAVVVLLLRASPVEQTVSSLMKGFVASTCVLAIIAWIMPAQADLRLGDPDYFNTNQIGNLCAFGVLFAQYLMSRKEGKWGFAAGFLTVTLVRSLSKTTLVSFLLCEGFLLARDRSIPRKTKLLIGAAVVAAGLSFWSLYESYYDVYTTAGNQAETLTGRTAIWAYALNAAVEKPWFGNGFDALWKVMPPFGPDQFQARHAENEVLQQFFAYGVVGVGLLIGAYGSLHRAMHRLPRGAMRTVCFTILVYVLIRGLAEAEPFDLLLPLWAITALSAVVETARNTESGHRALHMRGAQ
jgi:exopolysaccharide production protein ExoQ